VVNQSGKYLLLFLLIVFLCGCKDTQKEINSIIKDTVSKSTTHTDSIKINKPVISPKGVITKLPTEEKIIALTFDACETKTPVHFDEGILTYLTNEKIPFTIFVSGKFAKRNKDRLKELSGLDFVEIENHSMNHFQNMERLPGEKVKSEVLENEKILSDITGKKTKFFRFPGGNYNQRVLDEVESLGYRVVHWRVPSGDPDKRISVKRLVTWVMYNVKPGDILIFHINGRGYKTSEALPLIVRQLREQGYRLVRLDEYIKHRL
jgi:peptidoglycan/xylan/chitin deacetylase (PgdA/CDA1 family)